MATWGWAQHRAGRFTHTAGLVRLYQTVGDSPAAPLPRDSNPTQFRPDAIPWIRPWGTWVQVPLTVPRRDWSIKSGAVTRRSWRNSGVRSDDTTTREAISRGQIKIVRANLIHTAVIFEKKVDLRLKYKFGPFGNTECRYQDLADMRGLKIDEAFKFKGWRRRPLE